MPFTKNEQLTQAHLDSMEALTTMFRSLQKRHPHDYMDVLYEAFEEAGIIDALVEESIQMQERGELPEGYPRIEREDIQPVKDEHCATSVTIPLKRENDEADDKVALKGLLEERRRKNREIIGDINYEDVKKATEKLTSAQIFNSTTDKQIHTVHFSIDTNIIEERLLLICRTYKRYRKMSFFTDVERAITAIIYHLSMETLKKKKMWYHTDMVVKLEKENLLSKSEMSRLKAFGSRMLRLIQKCGIVSLAIFSSVPSGRLVEWKNSVFEEFLHTVHENLWRYHGVGDLDDEFFVQFKEFCQKSDEFLEYIANDR